MGAGIEYWAMRHDEGRLRWAIFGIIVLIALGQLAAILIRLAPLPRPGGTTVVRQVAPSDQQPGVQIAFLEYCDGLRFAERAERRIIAGFDDGRSLSDQQTRELAAALCQEPALARFRDALESEGLRHVEQFPAGSLANGAISAAHCSSIVLLFVFGLLAVWIICDRDRFCLARGLCPRCLYELGAGVTRCPECGRR